MHGSQQDSKADIARQAAAWLKAARESGEAESAIADRLAEIDRKAAEHKAGRRPLLAKRLTTFAQAARAAGGF